MLHKFPDNSGFDNHLQQTDLEYLFSSQKALGSLAENYVGLPF
ncbi:MAG: p-hydroxybenzoate 3-monooxygenase [Paracoccaceae bacterium]